MLLKNCCLFTLLMVLAACNSKSKKDYSCQHAEYTLGNLTNDTIYYGKGTNYYTDTLLAGSKKTFDMGYIHAEFDRKGNRTSYGSKVIQFYTNHGSWAVEVDKCQQASNFEYDNDNPSTGIILLYSAE